MRAVLNHPSVGVWGQVLNSSEGKFDEEISEPSFLADPYHRVKVAAKHIFPSPTKVGLSDVGAPK